jgi:hypothetical protein
MVVLSCQVAPAAETRAAVAQVELPGAMPVPRLQATPLPAHQVSLGWDGAEVTRYHFRHDDRRPYLFPVLGPSGMSLTRMGHPHDPDSHSHHNSVWISHDDVNGDSYWSDGGAGRIVHRRLVRLADGADATGEASVTAANQWIGKEDRIQLDELRRVALRILPDDERLIVIDLELRAREQPVTFGQTAFGLIGVRMAKSVGVHDGGGLIRNSAGQHGEQGPDGCFRKPARWCDYSGPIATGVIEGITLMDHSSNVSHPTPFHVRDDGWMGACLTWAGPLVIEPGQPLRLRYALYIHRGAPVAEHLDRIWNEFNEDALEPLSP